MFGKRVTLFKILGFKVGVDASWLIIAVLITWSLAQAVFPHYYRGLTASTYWIMGVIGALGLFASIVVHEFSHSIVARRFGLSMKGITLFVFGGVAEMEDEPKSAQAEFSMAIAGPLASVVIGIAFLALHVFGRTAQWPVSVLGVINYLGSINLLLAAFNLLPAFPLDGGRVLRSVLWLWKKDLRWATRVSSGAGSLFGLFMIFMGIFSVFSGAFIGGLWWVLIGLFLRGAAQMSYQRLLISKALEGEPVERFMKKEPVAVAPNLTIHDLIEDYVYKLHHKMFPVVDHGELTSCITTRMVRDVPRNEWTQHTVAEFSKPCDEDNTIDPQEDALKALSLMHRTGNSRLLVIDKNHHLIGIISIKDLLKFLSLKMDLEERDVENMKR